MEKKIVERVIRKSTNCRVRYGLPINFKTLKINIIYNGIRYVYEVDSQYLSLKTDSVRFYPRISNGSLEICWVRWISDHIKLIQKID